MFGTPEVLEVQEVPLSEEVKINPSQPTTTNVLFPYVTPYRYSEVPEDLLSQEVPLSEEVTIFPFQPTDIKSPFP